MALGLEAITDMTGSKLHEHIRANSSELTEDLCLKFITANHEASARSLQFGLDRDVPMTFNLNPGDAGAASPRSRLFEPLVKYM